MPQKTHSGIQTITGLVLVVRFYDEESGHTIMSVETDDGGRHSVVGKYHENPFGQEIIAHGIFENHPTHGEQFTAGYIAPHNPVEKDRIAAYLSSLGIPGIAGKTAKNISDHFGKETFDIIDHDPGRLREVPRVQEKSIDYLNSHWQGMKAYRELVMFLIDSGVPARHVPEIQERMGFTAKERIVKDPYLLSRTIPGFGFEKADAIATKFGIDKHDPVRKRAVFDDILQRGLSNGECGQPRTTMIEEASRKLRLPAADMIVFIDQLIDDAILICEEIEDTKIIYQPKTIETEIRIARDLLSMVGKKAKWGPVDFDAEIAAQRKPGQHELGTDQAIAVEAIFENRLTIMTGGPGVGKTTTIKTALDVLAARGVSIALCAPTGMAAKRMAEATGRTASTIHTLLGVDGENGGFQKNRDDPIHADIVVVDEFSMADINLAASVIEAIGFRSSLLIVGDDDQLPSVGPGRVLHDLIISERMPVCRLTQVHRQSKDSQIIDASHAINNGEMPPPPPDIDAKYRDYLFINKSDAKRTQEMIVDLVCNGLKRHSLIDEETFDPIRDVMVVAAMKDGDAGVLALNKKLRAGLNPLPPEGSLRRLDVVNRYKEVEASYGIGDKVMNTVNKMSSKGIVNGDVGYIRNVDQRTGSAIIEFDAGLVPMGKSDMKDIQLAYAVTVHKCQGSEAKVLLMPVVHNFGRMLQRNLIYTGLTRAKTLGIMVGQETALQKAIDNIDNHQRWSFTAQAIRRYADAEPEVLSQQVIPDKPEVETIQLNDNFFSSMHDVEF